MTTEERTCSQNLGTAEAPQPCGKPATHTLTAAPGIVANLCDDDAAAWAKKRPGLVKAIGGKP